MTGICRSSHRHEFVVPPRRRPNLSAMQHDVQEYPSSNKRGRFSAAVTPCITGPTEVLSIVPDASESGLHLSILAKRRSAACYRALRRTLCVTPRQGGDRIALQPGREMGIISRPAARREAVVAEGVPWGQRRASVASRHNIDGSACSRSADGSDHGGSRSGGLVRRSSRHRFQRRLDVGIRLHGLADRLGSRTGGERRRHGSARRRRNLHPGCERSRRVVRHDRRRGHQRRICRRDRARPDPSKHRRLPDDPQRRLERGRRHDRHE